jgi:hypothetical protein
MKRSDIRNLIRKRLGETTAAFWTDVELNTWIDDACTDTAFRTKCIKSDGYMTPVASTAEYGLTSVFPNCLSIDEVYFFQCSSSDTTNSTWFKLIPMDHTTMDIEHPGWKSATAGVPTEYYWDREDNLFGLYVKPDSNNSGTSYCRAYYRKEHTNMTSDTDTPDIPVPLQPALCDYVVALGFEQRGYGDKANDAWTKYFSKIKDYEIERHREREDEDIIMRNYRNIR